ncbi:bile acid:sodium symporter family protein [Marinoscillum furvescens]|uniref:BASS family bile acid:Na+ symporter n=1 Tax=Marinoscillum furvescens DSM 4134 TaxID=1122208 RepID=A0A3D9L777_MARFU|nr:bile acid:sodium symporter family protein [Marinoscillum furvescens]REE00571.1 BASS family bile acid:Na+ symporter [Marinoscillum furvescens DSM 4134]
MDAIDSINLNFSDQNILILNISLGFIMFGVALKLTPADFKLVLAQPLGTLVGVISQFLVLPFLTFLLVYIIEPHPSFALGMMMVAACPGGNISNFFSSMAKGNIALSVSLTAISSILAIFMTPINLSFWASMYEPTNALLREVSLSFSDVLKTIVIILGIPLVLGMSVRQKFPAFAQKLQPYMHYGSILIFAAIVIIAFSANIDIFLNYIYLVVFLVFFHNATALLSGYQLGRLFRLPEADCRSLAIETGIQNSGLGLLLIFAFFQGLGGMAIVAAWWGIWHIISGMTMAYWWNYRVSIA